MATQNGSVTLAGIMTGTAAATGIVKASIETDGIMTGSATAFPVILGTIETDGLMTGSAGAFGIVQASVEFDGIMTSSASASAHTAQGTVEFDGVMTSAAAASAHITHGSVTFAGVMTATAHAYETDIYLRGKSGFIATPQGNVAKYILWYNTGTIATATLTGIISASAILNGSSTIIGAVTMPGRGDFIGVPSIHSSFPQITMNGRNAFAANALGVVHLPIGVMAHASVTIAGQTVPIESASLQISDVIAQRTTGQFVVTDPQAQYHFYQGQQTIVRDYAGNRVFTGYVASSVENKASQKTTIQHTVSASDATYLADKRLAAISYANQTAGYIVNDLADRFLVGEGISFCSGKNILPDSVSSALSGVIPSNFHAVSSSIMRASEAILWEGQDCFIWHPNGATTFESLTATLPDSAYADNTTYTLSFYAYDPTGTASIRYGWYESNPSTTFSPSTTTLTGAWTRYTKTITTANPIANRGTNSLGIRIDTGSSTYSKPVYIAGLQIEQNSSATAWEFGGTVTIQPGPNVVAATINYDNVTDAIAQLAQKAGFIWYVDVYQRMWFVFPGTLTAPFNIVSNVHMTKDSVSVTNTSPLYRNRQYVLGVNATTAPQTETRQGDGKTRAFTFSYPLNQVPSAFTLNGSTKTLGVKGVDSGKDFYWATGDAVIAQDNAGTILTSSDTISMTYVGQYQAVIQADDQAAQVTRAMVEGSTTGIVESAITDVTVNSLSEGFQLAAGYLSRYVPQGQQVQFDTQYTGLAPGQTAIVSVPEHGIVNQSMLIEQIDTTDVDPYIIYTVTAIIGPYDTNWVAFFKKILQPATAIDSFSAGISGTLAILASFTGSAPSPSGTLTTTVNTVHFPSTTLYPSTTYPA